MSNNFSLAPGVAAMLCDTITNPPVSLVLHAFVMHKGEGPLCFCVLQVGGEPEKAKETNKKADEKMPTIVKGTQVRHLHKANMAATT